MKSRVYVVRTFPSARRVARVVDMVVARVGQVRLFFCAECYWQHRADGSKLGATNTLRSRIRREPLVYAVWEDH